MTDNIQATQTLHTDLKRRLVVDASQLPWHKGRAVGIWQKILHRSGADNGQLTAIVRYEPGARWHEHEHPDGEEILVLEGIFSNRQGNWPAGSYLLKSSDIRNESWSEKGCTVFIKLRQLPGSDRDQVAIQTSGDAWRESVRRNVHWKKLYAQEPYADFMRLEAWDCPAELGQINFPRGAELLVLSGGFSDREGIYKALTWLRIPAGGALTPDSDSYCELYIKEGGFDYLWTSSTPAEMAG
ncbi:MAG: cupin domain-containing protein [Parahaliea sp.]